MFHEIYESLKASEGWHGVSSYHIDLLEACYLLAKDDEDFMSAIVGMYDILGVSVIEYRPPRMYTTVLMQDKTDSSKYVILTAFVVY